MTGAGLLHLIHLLVEARAAASNRRRPPVARASPSHSTALPLRGDSDSDRRDFSILVADQSSRSMALMLTSLGQHRAAQ